MKTDEQGNFVYDFPFLLGAVHTYHGEPLYKKWKTKELLFIIIFTTWYYYTLVVSRLRNYVTILLLFGLFSFYFYLYLVPVPY